MCLAAVPVATASGQRLTSPTFDLAAESWKGRAPGRVFWNPSGLALDAVAAWRVRQLPHGALLAGAGGAWQGHFLEGDSRLVPVEGRPNPPDFPTLSSLTALSGVEQTFGLTLRALAGPAVFFGQSPGPTFGLEGRAVLSTPSILHVALLFSARGAIIPNSRGQAYQMGALGAGIRWN
jgi:hypothetical protein